MTSEFTITTLHPRVLQIGNTAGDCCTLVLGDTHALLFDTMRGIGDLKAQVSSLTDLPLIVVNSHGHFDHMGGNVQFEKVYMDPKDFQIPVKTLDILAEIERNVHQELCLARESMCKSHQLLALEPGTVFDLGGVSAKVLALPGHTAGSIGLYLPELRLVLAGDAVSPTMCLFYPDSVGLKTYQQTLNLLMEMDFDSFIQGHYKILFPKSMLDKFYACTLLPGTKRGLEYINTQVPEYKGKLYMLELRNPEIDSMICLIDA